MHSSSTVVIQQRNGPGCLIQALWFIFIGSWLGAILIGVAWFFNVTIIGLPLGMLILNNIPKVLALQENQRVFSTTSKDGVTVITESGLPQNNILLRIVFFLLIGWWWSGIWLSIGYLLCATILLMPLGLGMFRLTPAMTTLRRY